MEEYKMREHKYRVWDAIEDLMTKEPLKEMIYFSLTDLDETYVVANRKGCYLEGKCKIMEYIGLKDINHKDIYEGDILRVVTNSRFYQNVLVDKRGMCFGFKGLKRYVNSFVEYTWDTISNPNITHLIDLEIIGNRFENPELLENK